MSTCVDCLALYVGDESGLCDECRAEVAIGRAANTRWG